MKAKISVWAFNNFTRFDAIANALGCESNPTKTYNRADSVKMVNSNNDFKMDLLPFLSVIKERVSEQEFSCLNNTLFKKNGEIRKLEGKEIKWAFDDFFLVFNF